MPELTLAIVSVCVFGLLHGLILFGLLLRKRALNPTGIGYLMLGLAGAWLVVVEELLVASGTWVDVPHILRSTTWMPFLFGPAIWLFVRTLHAPDYHPTQIAHFLPAVAALLYFVPFYAQAGEAKIEFVSSTSSVPLVSSLMGTAKILSVVGYCLASALWLRLQPKIGDSSLVKHLQRLLWSFLILLVPLIALFAAEHRWPRIAITSDLIGALYLAALMYLISLVMLSRWEAFVASNETKRRLELSGRADKRSQPHDLLDEETTLKLYSDISRQVREEQLFRTPGIGVRDLAEMVGVAHHYLSYVINKVSGENYNSWLNTLRVEAAKELLASRPEVTVLQAGLEAGFNSKAVFNRAFKSKTGMSPSAFRNLMVIEGSRPDSEDQT